LGIGVAAWAIMPIWLSVSHEKDNPIAAVIAVTIFGSAVLWLSYFLKCPRCRTKLGQIAIQLGIGFFRPKPNFCPYCGASFDEAMTQPGTATQVPYNPIR
jgi:hypothetical protein